jgi:hypothetical protein
LDCHKSDIPIHTESVACGVYEAASNPFALAILILLSGEQKQHDHSTTALQSLRRGRRPAVPGQVDRRSACLSLALLELIVQTVQHSFDRHMIGQRLRYYEFASELGYLSVATIDFPGIGIDRAREYVLQFFERRQLVFC